ncbi:MAG: hypothetical protein COA58_03450 [Bacteroidetes bacterium]|nr:MAG: hypothetical protein COA58_03450 [Bacteroidota bacterium]
MKHLLFLSIILSAIACETPEIDIRDTAEFKEWLNEKTNERKAEYYGGDSAMSVFISTQVVYPDAAFEENVSGEVRLQFVINKRGGVQEIQIISDSMGFGLEEEATRVIKETQGLWRPALQLGERVKMKYSIPITFYINYE